ncbi:unnamed protein product [Rotaria sp. Silwood1]|nr:unnamed protein product [Rotaria sp. Silwood1]CAF1539179.1 unnamed protein product [Rotaria sp. Silwood1]
MGQKNTAFMDKESYKNRAKNQQIKSFEQQNSMPHRHYISSESTNNNSHLSTAEHYINMQSQMMLNQNNHQLEISSSGRTTPCANHAEIMHKWHNRQVNEIYKNMPYRYQYETSSYSSKNSTYHKNDNQIDTYGIQKPYSTSNIDHKKKR